jgi:hypothetical protein
LQETIKKRKDTLVVKVSLSEREYNTYLLYRAASSLWENSKFWNGPLLSFYKNKKPTKSAVFYSALHGFNS